MTKSILVALRDVDPGESIEVRVDYKITMDDFRKAVEHGRVKKWTHEKDGEWGELIAAAIAEGVIQADVDDTTLVDAPEPLFEEPE